MSTEYVTIVVVKYADGDVAYSIGKRLDRDKLLIAKTVADDIKLTILERGTAPRAVAGDAGAYHYEAMLRTTKRINDNDVYVYVLRIEKRV